MARVGAIQSTIGAESIQLVAIERGKIKTIPIRNVDRDWFCVPEGVVDGRVVGGGDDRYFVIKGRMVAQTTCRVGRSSPTTDPVFEIFVTEPAEKPKPTKPKPRTKRARRN